jgi:hypothetical protein
MVCNDSGLCEEEGCPGIPLTTDGVLDIDLKAIRVSGAVTLNGAPLPNATGSRGSIVFSERKSGKGLGMDLETTGPITYEVVIPPGVYDVRLEANPSLCLDDLPSPWPCVSGPILTELNLSTDGVLDIDIPAVWVQGSITLKGAQMPPESSDRGSLVFSRQGGGSASTKSFETTKVSARETTSPRFPAPTEPYDRE